MKDDRLEIDYEDIPTDRDIFVLAERDLNFFNKAWDWYIAHATTTADYPHNFLDFRTCAVSAKHSMYLELDLLVDQSERFHEILHKLPRKDVIQCVRYWNWAKRPYLIVSNEWFDSLKFATHTTFAMVDAIGVRKKIFLEGKISRKQLILFRRELDSLARRYPSHVFFSFADSVILKSNWKRNLIGFAKNYDPEMSIHIINQVQSIFKRILELDSYAVVTQGLTDDYERRPFKKSFFGSHIAFNSLGTPFSYLFDIERHVKANVKKNIHKPSSLYLSKDLFLSLKLKSVMRDRYRNEAIHFSSDMTPGLHQWYFCSSTDEVLTNLNSPRAKPSIRWQYHRAVFHMKQRMLRWRLAYRLGGFKGLWQMG